MPVISSGLDMVPADDVQPRSSSNLTRRILRRLGATLFVLWGTVTITFLVLSILPGDRATILLNIRSGQAIERTPEELAPINAAYGFDQPIAVQYIRYVSGLLHGDLGASYELQRPVLNIISEQIAPTFTLAIAALVLAWIFTIPWTLLTAGRGARLGAFGSAAETILAGLPQYWVGILLLIVFAIWLNWFPVIGGTGLVNTVLPTVTLAVPLAGFIGQSIRSEFDRAMREPFVLSARARGMSAAGVRARHVLRHALIPGITLSGWAIGHLLSGTVLVEAVFARPGLGAVLVNAVNTKDFALVSGILILNSFLYVLINFIVDLIYLVVDPRLRDKA
ncbi:peptide/nickel transport system permease protein [Arboricoccus pini]|uniref:Peptide/nickel transport system permease protein n=1 Tax=Arboricoccus pini TaxID=1963835 RepID=A0A212RF42_9PROT|nr:ABC transporter permease [Arboricoccus pini]SNB70918.1 peptide/nickel transport system permease protein [Arboricoccus pini]